MSISRGLGQAGTKSLEWILEVSGRLGPTKRHRSGTTSAQQNLTKSDKWRSHCDHLVVQDFATEWSCTRNCTCIHFSIQTITTDQVITNIIPDATGPSAGIAFNCRRSVYTEQALGTYWHFNVGPVISSLETTEESTAGAVDDSALLESRGPRVTALMGRIQPQLLVASCFASKNR